MSARKRFPPWVKIRAVPECQRSTIRLDFCPEHLNYVKVGAEKAGSQLALETIVAFYCRTCQLVNIDDTIFLYH